jgi:hypothetical protein
VGYIGGDFEIEVIPDGDDVSRHIFRPHKYREPDGVIWETAFIFDQGVESVVWRKYAPKIPDVHEFGLHQQRRKLEARPDANYAYVGALTASVANVRSIRTARGFQCKVRHDPSNAQGQQHAEVSVHHEENQQTKKSDRADLRVWLKNAFNQWEKIEG